ncbi:MAG: outer membrane lipoprotein-sorting protein [Bacteroidales bacterium]|nr:outer membrane lipoprotein-sorting protein [Bacteroidales bacterium]
MNKKVLVQGIILLTGFLFTSSLQAQNATEIVKRADAKMRGENSGVSEMSMQIIRPKWTRTIEFKIWSKGTDKSMVLVTAPAEEKGQSFLKVGNEMWRWSPTINRTIKLPPSMLAQGWLGSDYTNDDMVNQRSIVTDYEHEIIGEETIEGMGCYLIELTPREDSPAVWGKVLFWITQSDDIIVKSEYFDEDEELVKTETGSGMRVMDGRKILTVYEILPADEEDQKTIVTLKSIKFNESRPDSFFSIQKMKNLRVTD